MLGIALEAGGCRENFRFRKSGGTNDTRQGGLAIGQRSGLIENERPARINPFEHRRILDNDAAPRG